MKVGDMFYSVMQKDNCPFEKPRIAKFIVEKIDTAHSYPIVSTKTDKWGRHYAFRESQIHLTYEDALVEKKKIIEKIEKWEKEKREQDRLYFEELERKEKQRQIDHDKQVRREVVQEIIQEVKKLINSKDFKLCNHEYANGYCYGLQYDLAKILDKIQGEPKKVFSNILSKKYQGDKCEKQK